MSSPARKKAEEKAMELKKRVGKQPKRIVGKTYVTKAGDTVSDIAKLMGTTVSKIKAANARLKDVNKLPKGIRLKLPVTKTAGNTGTFDAESNPYKEDEKVKLRMGGSLRPVPKGSGGKGLSKLPTQVRNKMGFMNKGSLATKKNTKSKAKCGKGIIIVSIGVGKVKPNKKTKAKKKT